MWECGYAWGRNGHVYEHVANQSVVLSLREYITKLGRDGCEFCGALPERDGHVLIFKRPSHK
jgi:hypothetical protein